MRASTGKISGSWQARYANPSDSLVKHATCHTVSRKCRCTVAQIFHRRQDAALHKETVEMEPAVRVLLVTVQIGEAPQAQSQRQVVDPREIRRRFVLTAIKAVGDSQLGLWNQ